MGWPSVAGGDGHDEGPPFHTTASLHQNCHQLQLTYTPADSNLRGVRWRDLAPEQALHALGRHWGRGLPRGHATG